MTGPEGTERAMGAAALGAISESISESISGFISEESQERAGENPKKSEEARVARMGARSSGRPSSCPKKSRPRKKLPAAAASGSPVASIFRSSAARYAVGSTICDRVFPCALPVASVWLSVCVCVCVSAINLLISYRYA